MDLGMNIPDERVVSRCFPTSPESVDVKAVACHVQYKPTVSLPPLLAQCLCMHINERKTTHGDTAHRQDPESVVSDPNLEIRHSPDVPPRLDFAGPRVPRCLSGSSAGFHLGNSNSHTNAGAGLHDQGCDAKLPFRSQHGSRLHVVVGPRWIVVMRGYAEGMGHHTGGLLEMGSSI